MGQIDWEKLIVFIPRRIPINSNWFGNDDFILHKYYYVDSFGVKIEQSMYQNKKIS